MLTYKANLIVITVNVVQNLITSKKFSIMTGEYVETVNRVIFFYCLIFSFTHFIQLGASKTLGRTGLK